MADGFDFIDVNSLTEKEKKIYAAADLLFDIIGGKPAEIETIAVSEKLFSSDLFGEINSIYQPTTKTIIVKRSQLKSLEKFASSLLYESLCINDKINLQNSLIELIGILACKIVQYDNAKYAVKLPNIDFSSFTYYDQLKTAGIHSSERLSAQLGAAQLAPLLESYVRSCKISKMACYELVDNLDKHGLKISIADNVIPDISALPSTFSDEANVNDLEHQMVINYAEWYMSNSDIWNTIKFPEKSKQYSAIEKIKCIHNTTKYNHIELNYVDSRIVPYCATFPYNLIPKIFFAPSNVLLYFNNNIQKSFISQVDEILEQLPLKQRQIINLIYRNGYSENNIAEAFNTYGYSTLSWAFKDIISRSHARALRMLRHPSRSKLLRRFEPLSIDELHILTDEVGDNNIENLEKYYTSYISAIKESVAASFSREESFYNALTPFYDDNVIELLSNNKWRWIKRYWTKENGEFNCAYSYEDLHIDDLDLPSDIKTTFNENNINNLQEIWNFHGNNISLYDFDKSGLCKIFSDYNKINRIFDLLFEYDKNTHYVVSDVDILIDSAEELVTYNQNDFLHKVCLNEKILKTLWDLKYRTITQLKKDYHFGEFYKKFNDYISENPRRANPIVFAAVELIVTGNTNALSVIIDYNKPAEIAQNVLHKESKIVNSYNLKVRYLSNSQINNLDDIKGLFQRDYVESSVYYKKYDSLFVLYNVFNKTINNNIVWIEWPIELLKNLNIYFSSISTSYIGYDNTSNKEIFYLIVKHSGTNEKVSLYCIANIREKGAIKKIITYDDNIELICSNLFLNIEKRVCTLTLKEKYYLFDIIESFCTWMIKNSDLTSNYAFYETYRILAERKIAENPFSKTIEALSFSNMTYNCLKNAGIHTISQLADKSPTELLSISNIGAKRIEEICTKLHQTGIEWFPIYYRLVKGHILSIEELNISVASFNWLKRNNINTINDLITLSKDEVYGLSWFSSKRFIEVYSAVKALGISWLTNTDFSENQ